MGQPKTLPCVLLPWFLSSVALAAAANEPGKPGPANSNQIQIPDRPSKSLFKGKQVKQKTEIYFDPSTGMVTMKLVVQDPQAYFIPNIRRDNFVVYENGMR